MNNNFFVFEGPDCVGKTTAIEKIKCLLEENNYPVTVLCEPTKKTPVGAYFRNALINNKFSMETKKVIVEIDRKLNQQFIIDNINSGKIVLQDRYWLSTLAYNKSDKDAIDSYKYKHHIVPSHIFILLPKKEIWKESIFNKANKDSFESNIELMEKTYDFYANKNLLVNTILNGNDVFNVSYAINNIANPFMSEDDIDIVYRKIVNLYNKNKIVIKSDIKLTDEEKAIYEIIVDGF